MQCDDRKLIVYLYSILKLIILYTKINLTKQLTAVNMMLENEAAAVFRGFGQIMLQENAITGLFFLIGVAFNSLTLLIGLVCGGIVGHVSAKLFKFDPADIATGSYGFNGALVGGGLSFFHGIGLSSIALILVGGILSALIMQQILHWGRLPPYTAPFVIAMWLMLFIADVLALGDIAPTADSGQVGEFWVLARGVGQVMFQNHWLTGVIFIVGIALNSLTTAAWALIGSAIGLVTARSLGFPDDFINNGLYGFNAVLVAIALSSQFPKQAAVPLFGIVLSVLMTRGFQLSGLPSLTAPFILSAWMMALVVIYFQAKAKVTDD